MTPKLKNIIIFVSIALILILAYVFFIKKDDSSDDFLSSSVDTTTTPTTDGGVVAANSSIAQDFLSLLLSIKSLKLDDSIFSDPAFLSLHDSTIILVPDGNEGRPNPFAPIGSDITAGPLPNTPATGTQTGSNPSSPAH